MYRSLAGRQAFLRLAQWRLLFALLALFAVAGCSGTVAVKDIPLDTLKAKYANAESKFVDIDGTIHERCFSLAGSPNRADGCLELTVKANPTGRVSRHLVDDARPGQVLRLSAAQGEFVLPQPQRRQRHLVFISGGSGCNTVTTPGTDTITIDLDLAPAQSGRPNNASIILSQLYAEPREYKRTRAVSANTGAQCAN